MVEVQSPNILNWYPFKENQKIKEIKNIEEIDLCNEKFDVIILVGIFEKQDIKLEELIKKAEKILNENGKILIAVDNKFGIEAFNGTPDKIYKKKFASLIGYNNEQNKRETYTKSSIEKKIRELGYNMRFYYPLPDYKNPNVIFTDEQLPEYNSIDKYHPYFIENSDITFNEIDVFREILKTDKNMFTFFANSFLIEITKGECDKTYKYISFNNIRKEEYRLITKIADEYVEKQEVNEKAHNHYENIKNNILYLKEKEIKTVDYIENQVIRSKYIEQKKLLNNVLTELLEKNKINEFYEILNRFIKTISIDTYHEKDYDKTAFGKYGIEVQDKGIINDLHFTPKGLWDMTLKNCFYIENDFYFFDQEWDEPNLPVEYILYRSILYTISLRRFIKIEDLLEKYNLTKYLELFKKLDDKMQEMVRDDKTWKSYKQNNIIDIEATKQELINQNIRNKEQEQEIENLNIRSNAQKAETDNLKEQIFNLTEENKRLREQYVKIPKWRFLWRKK